MTTQFQNLAAANAAFYASHVCAIHTAQSLAARLQGNAPGGLPPAQGLRPGCWRVVRRTALLGAC